MPTTHRRTPLREVAERAARNRKPAPVPADPPFDDDGDDGDDPNVPVGTVAAPDTLPPVATVATSPAADKSKDIWAVIDAITDWHNWKLYLYRVEPRVKNTSGPAYISIFSERIDQQRVKDAHGGGTFKMILKDLESGSIAREQVFTIEGAPRFQPGQRLEDGSVVSPPAAAAPTVVAPPANADAVAILGNTLGELITELRQMRSGGPDAGARSLELMSAAYQKAVATIGTQPSPELAAVRDSLKELIDELKGSSRGRRDKSATQELLETIQLIDEIRGPREKEPAAGGELGLLKDIFGEDLKDVLRERLTGGGGPQEKSTGAIILEGIQTIVAKAPEMIDKFNQMQQANFERAMAAHNARVAAQGGGQMLPPPRAVWSTPPGNVAVPTVIPPAATAGNVVEMPPPVPASQIASTEQMINNLLYHIRRSWDNGRAGDVAAMSLIDAFPEVVMGMKDVLRDPAAVQMFVGSAKSSPILADAAADPDWAEFEKDFITEMQDPENWEPPTPDDQAS